MSDDKKRFFIGQKVRVKDIEFTSDDSKLANKKRGVIGTIEEIDLEYVYPYNIAFSDGTELMFKRDELERV
jgi:hypothetical protein